MFHLVYASKAIKPFTAGELVHLLQKSREKNTRLGITGLLLYKHGSFMQALEGDEDAVRDLYETISQDPRHHQIECLLRITVEQRQFPDWFMGFGNLDGGAAPSVEGYRPLRELPPWVEILPWKASLAMRLLASFNQEG